MVLKAKQLTKCLVWYKQVKSNNSCTVQNFTQISLMPNTHRRRRRDSTVELSRVGGVYAPVVSRDSWPSFQFSAPVTYRLQNCKLGHDSRRVCTHHRHNSTRQDKFSTCSVSKFPSAVVGNRRELVANSIHTADADATASAVCIGH